MHGNSQFKKHLADWLAVLGVPVGSDPLETAAARAQQEILCDVESAIVPRTVKSFAELHDYVDANGMAMPFAGPSCPVRQMTNLTSSPAWSSGTRCMAGSTLGSPAVRCSLTLLEFVGVLVPDAAHHHRGSCSWICILFLPPAGLSDGWELFFRYWRPGIYHTGSGWRSDDVTEASCDYADRHCLTILCCGPPQGWLE
jgi:hypothetical protein